MTTVLPFGRRSDASASRCDGVRRVHVRTNDEMHDLLWALPLFLYMRIEVTPLAGHPSDIAFGQAP